jgi:DNA replication protein DnaC
VDNEGEYMTPHNRNDKNDELKRINDALLTRRAELNADKMKKFGGILTELKKHLAKGQHNLARELAEDLRDTLVFGEVLKAFQEKPESFQCELCGEKIEGLAFKKDTLTWIKPHLCERCKQKEKESEMEKDKRSFANFVERNMETILKATGVEGLLLNASYDGFSKDTVQACKRSVMAKSGLYIWGGVGRGKTWLSVATLKDLIKTTEIPKELKKRVSNNSYYFRDYYRFVYVNWLLMSIKSTYDNNDTQTEQAIITEYTNIPVLVLDDIGAERPTEWVREKLNMIIYFRNNKCLKTLFTSNYKPAELQERLDERISSRIVQQCDIIHLSGPDRRIQ